MSAIYPLQVAIVARLKGNAGVVALVGARVFDTAAPEGTAAPWITIGSPTGVQEGGSLETVGFGHTIYVHAFHSDATGNEGVSAVAAAAKAALRAPLTIAGFGSTGLRLEFETVLAEPNIRHAPMRFRVLALEAAA